MNKKVCFSSYEWVYKSIKGVKGSYLSFNDIDTVIFDASDSGRGCYSNEQINRIDVDGIHLLNDLRG